MSRETTRISVLLLLTLFLTVVVYLLQAWQVRFIHQGVYYIIAFFFFLSLIITLITNQAIQHDAQKFVTFYLATMILRLLISFGVLLIVLLQDLPNKFNFILNFAVAYLIFLIFEIYTLLATLRANSEKGTEHVNKKNKQFP